MIKSIPPWIGSLVSVFAFIAPTVSAQNLSSLSDYSVIVAGNFTTGSDVAGRTVVGGNLNGQNSANFGTALSGKVTASSYTLRVGGSISSGNPLQISAGSAEIGGSRNNRTLNFNGGGSLIVNAQDNYHALYDQLVVASSTLSTISANSSYTMPGAQPSAFTFISAPNSDGLATFNVSAQDLFGNSKVQLIDLKTNGATDWVINVSGTSVGFNYGNLSSVFQDPAYQGKIVWNFYQAETVNLGSKYMSGLILAPYADVTAGSMISGTVVAENFTTTGKVDSPGYSGVFSISSSPIPEVSSVLVSLVGASMLVLRRYRA